VSPEQAAGRVPGVWIAAILLLLALRLPSLVQPAGGDQGLYGYAGQRILAGDVMYRDVWDQKPPAIAFVYAALWRVWPAEAIVPAADLVAAGIGAWLLVVIGRRRYSPVIGAGAATVFLLFGDPYLQRLSGIYVRSQCEPFIALAVAASLVLLAQPQRTRRHLVGAGVAFALAFWLKYNAAAYGLVLALAAWAWRRDADRNWRSWINDLVPIAAGFTVVAVVVLAYFAANDALQDLRLATIDYNLRYSNETYAGGADALRYLVTFPLERARVDPLWFLGGLGAILIAGSARSSGSAAVAIAWVLSAVLSIAINGSRSLPNYFVQANPALALAAAAGLSTIAGSSRVVRGAVALLLIAGAWRVGSDAPVYGWRLASLPGLVDNVRYDMKYARGEVDRETYLARFKGQKHDALEVERLARLLHQETDAADPILVFGFSGGSVLWKGERRSASRFFWSRPVITGFEADRQGYGSQGLLADLQLRPPVKVVLQKEEWHSRDFFMQTVPLRQWLEAGYVVEQETPAFSVWRMKP
jgi:hypothetical protein